MLINTTKIPNSQFKQASKPQPINILYFGGTFGCHGHPLSPIETCDFAGVLSLAIHSHQKTPIEAKIMGQQVIDSTQMTPQHLSHYIQCIYECMINADGRSKLVIIQGTDTLSYTAAYIARLCADWAIDICFVASMQPLCYCDKQPLAINPHSDALFNLTLAIDYLLNDYQGIAIAVHHILPAINTQKIDSHAHHAFANKCNQPKNHTLSQSQIGRDITEQDIKQLCQRSEQVNIQSYFALPKAPTSIAHELDLLIQPDVDVLMLMGYGAQNFPYHPAIEQVIKKALAQSILVIMTSQVPFGDVSSNYATGTWLTDLGVLSAPELTIPACHAKACWVCTMTTIFDKRIRHWQAS